MDDRWEKIWEAFWGDPNDPSNNTEEGLRRVVEVVLDSSSTPSPQTHMHAATVDRINQLEAELAEAVRWRDIYLRERNEERATFVRRAGELWQPLYDRAIAEREAARNEGGG